MRIIIETNEQDGSKTAVDVPSDSANSVISDSVQSVPPNSSHQEPEDGGGPSDQLIQAMANDIPTENVELDAGQPPEWLLKEIQNTASSGTRDTNIDINAGTSPDSKDY